MKKFWMSSPDSSLEESQISCFGKGELPLSECLFIMEIVTQRHVRLIPVMNLLIKLNAQNAVC